MINLGGQFFCGLKIKSQILCDLEIKSIDIFEDITMKYISSWVPMCFVWLSPQSFKFKEK